MTEKLFSENTGVRLSLVIAICTLILGLCGSMGGAIWWASGMSTKMNLILARIEILATADNQAATYIVEIKSRVQKLEDVGSTPLRDIEKRVSDLERKTASLKVK